MIDSIRILAFRIAFGFFLVGILACVLVGASVSVTFGAYVFGGITLGPVLTVLVQQVGDYRRSKQLQVIGRDVSVPRAVQVPTAWRDARWKTRDVRYAPDGGE